MDRRPVSAPLAAALVVLGIVLAVAPALLAGLVIGSDLRGCPRNVSTETCEEESG